MSRYDAKPFLRLLDSYVLSSIGHLPHEQDYHLSMLAPKLSLALNADGSWFEMVADQMDFAPDLPKKILEIWQLGLAKAEAAGLSVDPAEFARQFVDLNFAHETKQ